MNEIRIEHAFRYCPRCGKPVGDCDTKPLGANPFRCKHCDFVRFFGPFAAVGGLVINDSGQLLLVRRAKTPGKGLLGLPGGFIDAGETVEAALAREVREETSLELASSEYLTSNPNWYVHQGIRAPVIDLFYVCTVTAPDRVVLEESELCEFQWVIPTQKHLDSMAFESNRLAVLEWMETK